MTKEDFKLSQALGIGFTEDNYKMLLDLFHLYAPSHGEKPVLDFIKTVLTNGHIPFEEDDNGNIYCMNHKGEPILSAHTDCVGTAESGAYVKLIDIYPYAFYDDLIMKGIGNIGGDDKCGVFLILMYLLSGKPINATFSICEEIGGMDGIHHLVDKTLKDNEVFNAAPYALILDRRNPGDIICTSCNYGTKEFENALVKIGNDYGYSPAQGSSSDANTYMHYMNACNLSTAYYNPHSATEYVSITDLWNTWNYLNAVVEKLPRDIEFKGTPLFPAASASSSNGYNWNGSNFSKPAASSTSSWWEKKDKTYGYPYDYDYDLY